jgi:hypothetical protein
MSADRASSVKEDLPVTVSQGKDGGVAVGKGADAGTASGAKGRDGAPARQPAETRTRQQFADAMLAGPPVRPREAPGTSAATDDQQARTAGQVPPEHGRSAHDAGGGANATGQEGMPACQPATVLTRQDHADAMLARHSRPEAQEAPGPVTGPGPAQEGTRDGRHAVPAGRTETWQSGPNGPDSEDGSRPGRDLRAGTESGATPLRGPEAVVGRTDHAAADDRQAGAEAATHADGSIIFTTYDGAPGQRARDQARHGDLGSSDTRPDPPSVTPDHSPAERNSDHRADDHRAEAQDLTVVPDGHEDQAQEGATDQQAQDRRERDEQQRAVGEELAKGYEQKIDQQIDRAADTVNPRFDWTKSAYSENCTGVVQAYELRRRGHDVQAGALENHLRKDEGGPGGRSLSVIENAWGGKFTLGSKGEIEEAFKQPGSRGVVYIRWHGGGAHVFNVENNGGKVRFVDGQPTPARYDASDYFGKGYGTKYLRTDDRPEPPETATKRYLES